METYVKGRVRVYVRNIKRKLKKRNQKNQNLKKTSTFAKQTKNYNGKKFGNCRVTSKGKNY